MYDEEKFLNAKDFIVSKTDIKGNIIYGNEIFISISGYEAEKLIGAKHNIVRHPDMPKAAFYLVWKTIQAKDEFFGFVKNLCADGKYYWVFATISADLDSNGNIVSYTSVRRKPHYNAIPQIKKIYSILSEIEKKEGLKSSLNQLSLTLSAIGAKYNDFIIELQKGKVYDF